MVEIHAVRNTLVLAICQALFMSTSILSITVAAVAATTLLDDPALATLPQAMTPLVAMAVSVPASLYMRRVGRRAGFLLGAVLGIGSGAVCALALVLGSYAIFLLGVALLGAYQAFATYYRFAVADEAPAHLQARSVSLVLAGGVVAAVLGPSLAGVASGPVGSVPYLGSYLVMIALNALAVLAIGSLRLQAPARDVRKGSATIAALLRQPRFVLAVSCCAVGQGVMMLVMTATPLAMLGHGHSFGLASLVVSWHVLAMFVPSFFSGLLIDRLGLGRMLGAGFMLMIASALVAIAGTTGAHFAVALIVNGLAWNFLFVGGSSLLAGGVDADERALAQGANEFVTFGFTALATFASGALYAGAGWGALNALGIGASVVAAVAVAVLGRRVRAARDDGTARPRPPRRSSTR